jgi:cyclic beta-1,2-glucan synthetase
MEPSIPPHPRGIAPAPLRHLLDPQRGSLQPPIRSEIFGVQRFCQHGRSLGNTHRATRMPLLAATFFPRLKSNIHMLRQAHQYIGEQASTGYDISPAAEWLLDNFHTIEAQFKEIHEGLPRSYFRTLPMLVDKPLAGLPRIYGVAWAFVAHTDGAFDEELLVEFLRAYQETCELKLSEIWALPTTLRVVLIENLRRLAERVATNKAAREMANLCFDHIDAYDRSTLDQLLLQLQARGVGSVFLAQMAQRQQDRRASGDDPSPNTIQSWLHQAQPDMAKLHLQHIADQAADNLSVSNAVTALRAIGDADWSDIIARTSALMQRMLQAPLFAAEDATTRSQTLHAIEKLAQRSGRSEVQVATLWLHADNRAQLLHTLGLHEQWGLACQHALRRWLLPAYLLVLALVLGAMVWLLLRHTPLHTPASAWAVLAALAMVFPASEAVVAVINRLISESVRPQHLPRMALVSGIPAEHRVMVVIPCMLTSEASTAELAHRLALHYLANPEAQAQFALLTDWADADTAQHASDHTQLAHARQYVNALNQQHPPSTDTLQGASRFIVLHRKRTFSSSEQRWIGWERKRGKLEQLVDALATGKTNAFLDLGAGSRMASDVRYIVTLDSDTQLPPGRLRELVGIAAHPHNQPVLCAQGRTIVRGYGILQPRVATPLPAAQDRTLFHWLFAGQCGIDPYSAANSEVYQDVFHEGTFCGKGLLHVQALHAVLSGRLPAEHILSHDLVEGAIARCATVTDVSVIEDAPFHADVAATRVHRWTRGDWQLLPVLWAVCLGRAHYRMHAVNLWKMFDNLRRSLVAPMALVWVVLALAGQTMPPILALLLVYGALSAGPLMGALAGLIPNRSDLAKRHFFHEAGMDLVRALCGGLWHVAQLLQHALLAADAIGRALYRMAISRRLLLQWTTTAVAQTQARTSLQAVARLHWSEPLLALLLGVALLVLGSPYPALVLLVCLMWAASPVWTWWVSRTRSPLEEAALSLQDRAYLGGIARDTWRLFERCVVASEHHLPPDNLQLTPHDMVAHRTSPTNIGLYLLTAACARQFGWIGTEDLLARLEATLATLLQLQRHRGHFLNWYNTQTTEPLLPMYVSTVDSGNLVGHLLAVAQACTELAQAPLDATALRHALAASHARMRPLLAQRSSLSPPLRENLRWLLADHRATRNSAALDAQAKAAVASRRLHALAHAFTQLAWEADFAFLYHPKRHLLHIGYRVAEQQLDASFYDLLASESRLTSLFAIAKGDVPVAHWAALGRPFFAVGAKAGLRSWSGSMFEYLMPSLMLAEPHGSVLREACRAAVLEQIKFARAHRVPWGMSESAYAERDHTLAYQYAPQGVPRLSLRRTPPGELVVAPYATALAAQIDPMAACKNFDALEGLTALGRYGFIDALDFTPARQASDERYTPVSTYMAHHQGMTLVALANVLLDGPAQRWGMANPQVQAVSSLLHERVPRAVPLLYAPPCHSDALGARQHSAERPACSARSRLGPSRRTTHACAVQWPLQRAAARQRRWQQPLGARRASHVFATTRCATPAAAFFTGGLGSRAGRRAQQRQRCIRMTQHPAPNPQSPPTSAAFTQTGCRSRTRWPQRHRPHHRVGEPGRRH